MEKQIIKDITTDQERALYNTCDAIVRNCEFSGPADGESCLKECKRIDVEDCRFVLRYPLWHDTDFSLRNSSLADTTRAPLWYDENGVIENTRILGVKALRECKNIKIKDVYAHSDEFGWRCENVEIRDSELESMYFMFMSKNVTLDKVKFKGKYSFQYNENLVIRDSVLDTKDAFWHCKNVYVENCVVKGEYLAWYSDSLTLKNCKISGTQPFCYCTNLTLIDCTMDDTDLSFECSSVNAVVNGRILSIKNPMSGKIVADSVGEVIIDNPVRPTDCEIVVKEK